MSNDFYQYFLQGRGDAVMLRIQERLRQSLIPRYQHLFTHISRLEGGVKFLVDLRADVIVSIVSLQISTIKFLENP